jgi:hypothetical protein
MQPGDTITPAGQQPEPAPQPPVTTPEPPTIAQAQPAPESSYALETSQEDGNSFPEIKPLSWTASEFVEHQKPHGWYVLLTFGALVISAALYFLLRDSVTVVVVAVTAVLFGIVGARKPRSMSYTISQNGIQIGEKTFPYASFKSFSVIEEGAIDSIQLLPLKRFMPPISLYFPPEQEQEIFETLASYLPHEDRRHDPIDRLMKRLHF